MFIYSIRLTQQNKLAMVSKVEQARSQLQMLMKGQGCDDSIPVSIVCFLLINMDDEG